jgi:hypothetical protein
MDGKVFCRKLKSHPKLFPGDGPNKSMIQVIARPSKRVTLRWQIDPESILEHSWSTIESVLLGYQSPKIMSLWTRIVGYYSNLRNWNRSKIAELHDRRRGNYDVPEVTVIA